MEQKILKETYYDILQNKDGDLLFCVKVREEEPENPYIEYDGGANALFYRRPEQVILLDEVHPDTREAVLTAEKVLFAEFIPKSEQTKPEEEGVIREYMVDVRKVEKVPEFEEDDSDEEYNDDFYDETDDDDPQFAGERLRAMIANDPEQAKRVVAFYTEMANEGNVGAMYELGMLYYEGIGVEYDYVKTMEWMHKAADQGLEKAVEFIIEQHDDDGRYDGEI